MKTIHRHEHNARINRDIDRIIKLQRELNRAAYVKGGIFIGCVLAILILLTKLTAEASIPHSAHHQQTERR